MRTAALMTIGLCLYATLDSPVVDSGPLFLNFPGLAPEQKMFQDRTEAAVFLARTKPGTGLVRFVVNIVIRINENFSYRCFDNTKTRISSKYSITIKIKATK